MTNGILAQDFLTAQTGVLGSMLIYPGCVGQVVTQMASDDFSDGPHRQIFDAYCRLYAAGLPCDSFSVGNALLGAHRGLMAQMMDMTPTAANVAAYVDMAKDASRRVRLQNLAIELAETIDGAEQGAILDKMNALGSMKSAVKITTLADGYAEFVDDLANGVPKTFMSWGLPKLDEHIFAEPGDFLVIGGYPSAGKTAFALQVCRQLAAHKRVGYFYLENNDRKLIGRLVSACARVPMADIKRNQLGDAACAAIVASAPQFATDRLAFVDAAGMTVADIGAIANSQRFDVIVVDYLQKVASAKTAKGWDDFARVSAVSDGLQVLGKTTGRTVIALSQLSRAEKDKSAKVKAPTMASLRQSGQIEQDADVVLLLYADVPDDKTSRVLKIAKNKEGEAGKCLQLDFDGNVQTFSQHVQTAGEQYRNTQAQIDKAAKAAQVGFSELPHDDLPDEWRGG